MNWVERGNEALSRGALREALVHFTRATQQIPLDPVPWYDRALTYARLGQNAEALADAQHAVALNAFFDDGYALIARLQKERGALGAALAAIDRAIDVKREDSRYHVLRADVLCRMGRVADASAEYAGVLRREPNVAEALYGQAKILLQRGRDAEALALLQRYAAVTPGDHDTNVATAGLLVQTGRARDALAWIAAHPSPDPRIADVKVRALLQLGDVAAATAALPPAAQGESADRATLRGQLAYEAGRCREAADAYRVAAAAPDADTVAWRDLGAASACAKDDRSAVAALTRAIELNPADALARRYRAAAYRSLGNRRAAIADAAEALRLGGPDADLLMLTGVDEYLAGLRDQGRRDYARGCALVPASQTEKRRLCAEQLPKMRARP